MFQLQFNKHITCVTDLISLPAIKCDIINMTQIRFMISCDITGITSFTYVKETFWYLSLYVLENTNNDDICCI